MLVVTHLLVAVTALILGLRFNGFVLGLLIVLMTTRIFVIAIWNGGKPALWHCNCWRCLHSFRSVTSLAAWSVHKSPREQSRLRVGCKVDLCTDYPSARRYAEPSSSRNQRSQEIGAARTVGQPPEHFDADPDMVKLCKQFADYDASIKPNKLFERKVAQCILVLSNDADDITLANKVLTG